MAAHRALLRESIGEAIHALRRMRGGSTRGSGRGSRSPPPTAGQKEEMVRRQLYGDRR